MNFYNRKTIFDIIREAEEDESNATEAPTNTTQEEAPSPEESNEEASDDYGSDDDFNIDTTVDDITSDLDTDGGESGDIDSSDSNSTSSSDTNIDSDEEPVQANTDIFSSLTAEEQQIKIMELKRLFSDLYSSTDDILDKLNNTETDENNIEIINRVSMVLYSLRKYIHDYLINVFANKSFIENDIAFNRFLSILNSISNIIDNLYKEDKK